MKQISTLLRARTLSIAVVILALITLPALAWTTHATEPTLQLVTAGATGNGGNADSNRPSISADGTKIAFFSRDNNLTPGMPDTGVRNVYLYDTLTHTFSLISKGPDGLGGNDDSDLPSISADGTRIAFKSSASNLIDGLSPTEWEHIYVYDTHTEETILVTDGEFGVGGNNWSSYPTISGDGTKISFMSRATNLIDGITTTSFENIFRFDIASEETTLISGGALGLGGNNYSEVNDISYDGSRIAFLSTATNLIAGTPTNSNQNFFLWDENEGITLLTAGHGGDGSDYSGSWVGVPSISGDGTRVSFASAATNLITGTTTNGVRNIFLWDEAEGVSLVTAGTGGDGGNANSYGTWISGDGKMIGIMSSASDLVNGLTTNGRRNVFLYNIATQEMQLITKGADGIGGDGQSNRPTLSTDGSVLAFHSSATDLLDEIIDSQGFANIYLWTAGSTTHTVTFDTQDGNVASSADVHDGNLATEPTPPSREGYNFEGWWTAPSSGGTRWNFATDTVTGDLTLYARWSATSPDGGGTGNGTTPDTNQPGSTSPDAEKPPIDMANTGDNQLLWPALIAILLAGAGTTYALRRKNDKVER